MGSRVRRAVADVLASQSLAAVKAHSSQVVDEVAGTHDRVTISKNGSPVPILLDVEDYESRSETLGILSRRRSQMSDQASRARDASGEAYDEDRCALHWPPSLLTDRSAYTVVLSAAAERAIERDLPGPVSGAGVDLVYGRWPWIGNTVSASRGASG